MSASTTATSATAVDPSCLFVQTPESRCYFCNVQNPKLRSCTRCHKAAYCGRDCQRSHWKDHKAICDAALLHNAMLHSMGGSDDRNQDEIKKETKKCSKTIKEARKSGQPIMCMSMTAFGIVAPGMPIPEGVPPGFPLKQAAMMDFKTGPSRNETKLGNLKFEKSYRAYYDDIVENKEIWMTFFEHPENYEHAEHTCGILGTLATIYRQRGALKEAEEVLDMELQVLTLYKRHSVGACDAQVRCCDALEYKMHMIRYNLNWQLKRYQECIPLFRALAEYEYKYNMSFEQQEYLFMLVAVLNKPPHSLKSLTDQEVMKMVLAPLQPTASEHFAQDVEKKKERLALHTCAGCGKTEDSIRVYKSCVRCKNTFYCSKECQKKDWKAHKKVCSSAAK